MWILSGIPLARDMCSSLTLEDALSKKSTYLPKAHTHTHTFIIRDKGLQSSFMSLLQAHPAPSSELQHRSTRWQHSCTAAAFLIEYLVIHAFHLIICMTQHD